jgi:hypothetical protein
MDMNGSYEQEIRLHAPQADVVYDLFHVEAKFGREVIDRVRVDEANRLRHDKKARKIIKTARWLLLRNNQGMKEEQMLRLRELLEANRNLMTVYILKDDLKQLWRFTSPEEASRFWEEWYRRATESGIEPLTTFARRLKGYLHGILNHCRGPSTPDCLRESTTGSRSSREWLTVSVIRSISFSRSGLLFPEFTDEPKKKAPGTVGRQTGAGAPGRKTQRLPVHLAMRDLNFY